jgi:hypothetical protein
MLPMVLSFEMAGNLKIAREIKALTFDEETRCFRVVQYTKYLGKL